MVTFASPTQKTLPKSSLNQLENLDDFFYQLAHKAIDVEDMPEGLSLLGDQIGASKVDLISFCSKTNSIRNHWHTHSSGIRDWLYRWPYGIFRFQPIRDAAAYYSLNVSTLSQSLQLRDLEEPSGLEKAYLSCLSISDYCSMSFNVQPSLRVILIFSRSANEPNFDAQSIKNLERMAVKTKQSFSTFWAEGENQHDVAERQTRLQERAQPCLILNSDQSVLYSSKSFQQFCNTSKLINLNDHGEVVCSDHEFCDSLRRAADLVLSTPEDSELNAFRVVPAPNEDSCYALVSRSEFNDLGAIQIEFYQGELIPKLEVKEITDNLRATPGEANLCRELVRSGDLAYAANRCKLNMMNAKLFLNSLLTRNRLSNIKELQQSVYELSNS